VDSLVQRFVSLRTDVRLAYVEQGDPAGPPVIFLHGVTDSWRAFERILPLLPPPMRAFAISQRGHGDSSRPASGYRFADLAGDVVAFMDAMGLRTASVVGHSMGAGVATQLAIDHPDRLAGLVLMGAFASFQDPGFAEFVRTSIVPLRDPIAPAFAREWQLSTLARPMPDDHLEVVVAETLKVPAYVWHQAFEGFLATPPFPPVLRGFRAPTLLAWGDRDAYASRDSQDALLAALPQARLRVYEGGGHAFHWEEPAVAAADLVAFLQPVGAAAVQ
jgi:pimeloyl-ACP methyl ester carboxylesterase